MSGFQFVSSLVRALAWPAVVLGIAWLFRMPLSDFLSRLTEFHLAYGRLSAKVGADAGKAEAEALGGKEPTIVYGGARLDGGGTLKAEGIAWRPIQLPPNETPRPAVAIGYIFDLLTFQVRELLAEHGVEDANSMDWNRLVLLAHDSGLIKTDTAVALQGLEVLSGLSDRGRARRGTVSKEDADEYLRMANATLFAVTQNIHQATGRDTP